MSEYNPHDEELFVKLSQEKKRRRRKIIRTVMIVIVLAALALLAAVTILRRNVEQRFAAAAAEVQEYQVTTGTIHTVVAGSGVLTEVDLEQISVPAGVEITEVVAEAGDTVRKGDLLASVDMATVMTALSDLQEEIKTLDEKIGDAKGDEVSSSVTAGISGRVKKIYAEKDMDVSLCMARSGALALLSLDGYMAVDLSTDKLLEGETVTVTREDGSETEGKVSSAGGGKTTVLVTDNGPKMDEQVSVSKTDGTFIGKGSLYIHNPLAVTGYAGTVSSVRVKENAKVERGSTLFQLKNTSFSANYDSLLRDRADLEEIQMELLTIYRDGAVLAPMDGRVSSVEYSDDGTAAASGTTDAYAAYYGTTTTTTAAASSNGETNVLTIYPDLAMSIAISVDETDIMALEEGQNASITVSSVSQEETFPGTVTEISKVADTSTGVTRYSAEVTLDKAPGMLAGMTAEVDVQIEGTENALIIPIDALHQTSATYFVYTAYDSETNQYGGRVEVTIGMQNDSQVEILSGLKAGDRVFYTEAPQNFFAFMGSMAGMGGGMSGGRPSGMGGGMPSGMNRGG